MARSVTARALVTPALTQGPSNHMCLDNLAPLRCPRQRTAANVRDSHVKGGRRPAGLFRMAAKTAEQRRRRAETERRRYTIKRVAVLRALLPELVDDALATCALRQLSVAVRRSGVGQGTLAAFRQVESSSGPLSKEQPLCAELTAADARSAP